MWYVRGTWHGLVAWWGRYTDRAVAEELAKRVDGTVYSEEEVEAMRNN